MSCLGVRCSAQVPRQVIKGALHCRELRLEFADFYDCRLFRRRGLDASGRDGRRLRLGAELGRDGAELGRITQRNDVPAGVLSAGWDEVATAIAESASEGIVDLVGRVRQEASP